MVKGAATCPFPDETEPPEDLDIVDVPAAGNVTVTSPGVPAGGVLWGVVFTAGLDAPGVGVGVLAGGAVGVGVVAAAAGFAW